MTDFNAVRGAVAFWEGKKFGKVEDTENELKKEATQVVSNSYGKINNVEERAYYRNGQKIGSSLHMFNQDDLDQRVVTKGNVEYSVKTYKRDNPTFNTISFNVGGVFVTIMDNYKSGKIGEIDSNDIVTFKKTILDKKSDTLPFGEFLSGTNPYLE